MKETASSYKQAQNFIKTMSEQAALLKEKRSNVQQVLKQLYKQLTQNHISVIISVHQTGNLFPIVWAAQFKLKDQKNKQIESYLLLLYRLGFKCFFSKLENYKKLFQSLSGKEKGKKMTYDELSQDAKFKHQVLSNHLIKYFEIKDSKEQLIPKLKKLQAFINQQITQVFPLNAYEECFIGWVRNQLSILQNNIFQQLRIQTDCMCCRLLFFSDEVIDSQDVSNAKFVTGEEKQKFKKGNEFFKKIAIAFLNSFGGTIYLGIDCVAKKVKVGGVTFTEQEKKEFLLFLFDELTINILPFETELNIKADIQKQISNYREKKLQRFNKQLANSKNEYILNQFISLEFINIHDNQTLFFQRKEQEIGRYVIKINVRPGNQYNLYHLINEKESPEAYLWESKKEKKLAFPQFYEEVYRRLKAKANSKKYEKGQSPVHEFCRSFRTLAQPTNEK